MMEFNIGDRVRSVQYNKDGIVEDKLYSNKNDDWMYTVKFDGQDVPFGRAFSEDELEGISETTYRYEVFQADNNVMVAVLYEVYGNIEKEIARYHGHIMHGGMLGVAQAASYAMKKIYLNLGGTLVNRGGNDNA